MRGLSEVRISSRLSIALGLVVFLLVGCSAGSSDSDKEIQGVYTEVQGAAVKGPQVGATVNLYEFDESASDLIGRLVGTARTNAHAVIEGLEISQADLGSENYILEFFGGTESNGSAPAIATLRTVVSREQIISGSVVYATPLTTFVLELYKSYTPPPLGEDEAERASINIIGDLAEWVNTTLSAGLLSSDFNLFSVSPVLTAEHEQTSSLNYRTAIEIFAALIVQLKETTGEADGDALMAAVAEDMADGNLDGMLGSVPVPLMMSNLVQNQALFSQSSTQLLALPVPGFDFPISALNQQMRDELTLLGTEGSVSTQTLIAPAPRRIVVGADTDGDKFPDSVDEYPNDSTRAGDWDNDGIDSIRDVFPSDPTETSDADGDGTGDNADECPNGLGVIDTDGDGYCDEDDDFPEDPSRQKVDEPTARIACDSAPTLSANIISCEYDFSSNMTIQLDGTSSSDPNSDTLTYEWQIISQSDSSFAVLSDPNSAITTITGINGNDIEDGFRVTLTVSDGTYTNEAEATISIIKQVPTSGAMFGAGLLVLLGIRRKIKQSNQ